MPKQTMDGLFSLGQCLAGDSTLLAAAMRPCGLRGTPAARPRNSAPDDGCDR